MLQAIHQSTYWAKNAFITQSCKVVLGERLHGIALLQILQMITNRRFASFFSVSTRKRSDDKNEVIARRRGQKSHASTECFGENGVDSARFFSGECETGKMCCTRTKCYILARSLKVRSVFVTDLLLVFSLMLLL